MMEDDRSMFISSCEVEQVHPSNAERPKTARGSVLYWFCARGLSCEHEPRENRPNRKWK